MEWRDESANPGKQPGAGPIWTGRATRGRHTCSRASWRCPGVSAAMASGQALESPSCGSKVPPRNVRSLHSLPRHAPAISMNYISKPPSGQAQVLNDEAFLMPVTNCLLTYKPNRGRPPPQFPPTNETLASRVCENQFGIDRDNHIVGTSLHSA